MTQGPVIIMAQLSETLIILPPRHFDRLSRIRDSALLGALQRDRRANYLRLEVLTELHYDRLSHDLAAMNLRRLAAVNRGVPPVSGLA
jgi:hypothetical protein